jgi:hypothetical protein
MKKLTIFLALFSISYYYANGQQIKTPSPSTPQYLKQDFGLSAIEISYSRPDIRGRKIFGDLVPFGKVWRTGANQATTINFGDTVLLAGSKIPAGKYGLLSIPGEKEWTIIISKQLDVTNPSAYKPDQDILRIIAPVESLSSPVETFTIQLTNVNSNSCDLALQWERTAVSVHISADIDSKVMAEIDDALNKDNRPYFSAALYYLDNGKDLNRALGWFDKAINQNPEGYFIYYQKARCQAKMGKKTDAVSTAEKSMQLAKEANNQDYVALNQKLISSLK